MTSDHEATEPDPDERRAAEPDELDRVPRENAGNPWAKTSSGDADELSDDEQ